MCRNEIAASYSFDYPPLFPFPAHELPALPPHWLYQPSYGFFAALETWRNCKLKNECEQEDFPRTLQNFHILNTLVRERQEDLQNFQHDRILGLHLNSIIMDFLSSTASSSIWGRDCSVEKACRLAALIYLDEIRQVLNETYNPSGYHFVDRLRELIIIRNSEWEPFKDLRLWVVIVGGIFAVGENDRNVFRDAAREVMGRLGLHTWEAVREVVTDFVWIEPLFGPRFDRLQVIVMG